MLTRFSVAPLSQTTRQLAAVASGRALSTYSERTLRNRELRIAALKPAGAGEAVLGGTSGVTTILRPHTSQEAAVAAPENDARSYAGGAAIQVELANSLPPPRAWIDLAALPGRDEIQQVREALAIGAQVSLAALAANAEIRAAAPMLAEAVASVAAPAVRRFATLGGQIAGRTGCLPPALLALEAQVQGVHADGAFDMPLLD